MTVLDKAEPAVGVPATRKGRSNEELAMRVLCVTHLRARYPGARIIHELPLRYSSKRIDLAAITRDKIVVLEIKSSRDVADRLEAQISAFVPIAHRIIVALAPKWNEALQSIVTEKRSSDGRLLWTSFTPQYTPAQAVIRKFPSALIEVWTCSAASGAIAGSETTAWAWRLEAEQRPWPQKMLDVLHVSELEAIAFDRRVGLGKRPTHTAAVLALCDALNGREATRAVCRALRRRDAFDALSDPPAETPDGPDALFGGVA